MEKDKFLEAALYYRRTFKWSVIPLAKGSKVPNKGFSPIEYRERLASFSEIIEWWGRWPESNVGIVTGHLSNLFVVDIDSEEGQKNILEYIPDSLVTPTVKTIKGQHLYFQYPKDSNITIGAGKVPGTDFRGEGGYIVAPPSLKDGKQYEWIISPTETALSQLPILYINAIYNNIYTCVRKNENSQESVTKCDINLNKGTRDQSIFHVAHTMIKGGATKEETLIVLKLIAQNCNPPFPESEIVTKCHSAIERFDRKEKNVAKEVEDFVSVTSGDFSVTQCDMERQLVTKEERAAARKALSRLKEKGIIEKAGTKDGWYRRVETQFETINFDEHEPIEFEYPIKLPLGLNDIAEVSRGNIILVAGEFNAGKGHPHGTDILTDRGWEKIEDLKIGDILFSEDGEKQELENIFPRGEQDCYKFTFNDGTFIESDSEHIWSVLWRYNRLHKKSGHGAINNAHGKYKLTTTKEIVDFCGEGEVKNNKRFVLPQMKPINFEEKELILDPYLLGVLLGDGCFANSSIMVSSSDKEILDSFSNRGFSVNHNGKYDYRILGMVPFVEKLGLKGFKSNNKFIPIEYLYNSVKNRLSLLSGLLDTDGYIGKNSVAIEFVSVSKKLADGVIFLVRSLGGRAVCCEKKTSYVYNGVKRSGQLAYRVSIKMNGVCPFRLQRKINNYNQGVKRDGKIIKKIEYTGIKKTICLKVSNPTGLYIAKDFIVTHNTSFCFNILKDNIDKLPIRYITSEMSKSEFKKRFATFGLPLDFWKQSDLTDYVKKSSDFHAAIRPDAINIIDYMEFKDSDYTKGAEYLTQIHDKLTTGVAIVAVQKKEGTRMPRSGDMIVEKPRLAISFSKSVAGQDFPQGVCEVLKCKMPKVGKIDGKKLRFELQERGSKFFVLNEWGYWRGM